MATSSTKRYINFDDNPKQMEALKFIGTGKHIFYGGARGGGKTHLSRCAGMMVAEQFPGIRILIMRKHRDELEELFVQRIKSDFPENVFHFKYKARIHTVEFENGSRIILRPAETNADIEKIKGLEYQFVIIDEANEFTEHQIQAIMGSLRNPNIPGWKETLLMTGNPGGMSDLYFKTHFINPDYKHWRENELKYKDKYVFISAKVQDNKFQSQTYIDNLDSLDHHYREAWLKGNWNVFVGQFFEEFNEKAHVVDSFDIPKHWIRQVGIDYGKSKEHPTVAIWTAQDPETLDIHVYREYSNGEGNPEQFAMEILAANEDDNIQMWWGDPSMFGKMNRQENGEIEFDQESPAFMFLRSGLFLSPANNERINGWRILKQWIHWSQRKPPKIKYHSCCVNTIQIMPILRYNSNATIHREDLDTRQKWDDFADAQRYVMASGWYYPTVTDIIEHSENKDNYDFVGSTLAKKATENFDRDKAIANMSFIYDGEEDYKPAHVEGSVWADKKLTTNASNFIR